MPARVVRDWLAEYKALPDSELNTYANTIRNNEDLVDALYDMFEEDVSHEVLDPVCHQLFEFYRCGHQELQRFAREALPVMIGAYLRAHSHNDKKRCSGIEACLLGVYNLEIIGDDGKPVVKTYTIPTLAISSVYHEPPSLATLALTESALLRYHSEDHIKITTGPLPQVERIHSQNRLTTLTYILNRYNADLANLSPRSHFALCKMASRVTKTGFDNLAEDDTDSVNLNDSMSSYSSRNSRKGIQFKVDPRIQLSSGFLVELLNGVYYTMFNGQAREGIQALDDIHLRASYELYADTLLVTNAIKNSLQYNPSGQPQDGPMGISISLSPVQSSTFFSKNAITNASFRTKKLPEDIDVPDDEKNSAKNTPNSATDNPPNYDEIVTTETDKSAVSKLASAKIPKQLKSIMKKGSSGSDKQEKAAKVHKKDPEAIKRDRKSASAALGVTSLGTDAQESHSPKNPKHSISMTTGLAMSQNGATGGDLADPSMVGVQVIRSSSSGVGRTFQMVDYVDLKQTASSGGQPANQRASNISEDSQRGSSISEDSVGSVSQSGSHSREVNSASNVEEQMLELEDAILESSESADTAL